jgi:hypothetical protein
MTLRTEKTQARYDRQRNERRQCGCYLCRAEPIRNYLHWKIITNEYPYDRIAANHHIVTLQRHASEQEMTEQERKEFEKVRRHLHQRYDMIFENTVRKKSIPGHHHIHAITLKSNETPIHNYVTVPDGVTANT